MDLNCYFGTTIWPAIWLLVLLSDEGCLQPGVRSSEAGRVWLGNFVRETTKLILMQIWGLLTVMV